MKRFFVFILSAVLTLSMVACAASDNSRLGETSRPQNSGKAAYTIMVYIDGANLESQDGLATMDLEEMISATYSRSDINVIVQTGGAKTWHMGTTIPADAIGRYRVTESGLEELQRLPQQNMVLPATLTDFINYSYQNFPADKYGLVMWDHGAGPIYGYGQDENFDLNQSLYLVDFMNAFQSSEIAKQPLEFLGFDSCMMAQIEFAQQLSPYSNYLIASQENEPGKGWDYNAWLSALGLNPRMSGEDIGRAVAESFIDFYRNEGMQDYLLTLSVVDMKKAKDVVSALEAFVRSADLSQLSFQEIARDRDNTKDFGATPNYSSDQYDVIDMMDMAKQFSKTNSAESNALASAVRSAVLYNTKSRNNDIANGLSIFFPYDQREYLKESMEVYKATGFSPIYSEYLDKFVTTLASSPTTPLNSVSRQNPTQESSGAQRGSGAFRINVPTEEMGNIGKAAFSVWQKQPDNSYRQVYRDGRANIDTQSGQIRADFNGRISTINDDPAVLYEADRGEDYVRYVSPAVLNDIDVNLQILVDKDSPTGRIIGAIPINENSHMAPRQILDIKNGDRLAMLYNNQALSGAEAVNIPHLRDRSSWATSETRTIIDRPTMAVGDIPSGEYLYGFAVADYQGNYYLTDHLVMSF